jgi:aldose 1-epimerase
MKGKVQEMSRAELLTLSSGDLRVELSPSVGGAIATFQWTGAGPPRDLLRKCNGASKNVLDLGSFPLVPYVNRIRGGRFQFRGREVRLAANMSGDVSPLHGQGWVGAWRVEHSDQATAVLAFEHSAGEWPWSYEARQHFSLDPDGLSVVLSCRNASDEPMPCGLGQHPYFPCSGETRIDAKVDHVWTIDEHVLPVDKVPAVGRFDLRDRQVCGQDLDHGFGGWGGSTRLTDPEWPYDLEISSPEACFFQLYSPPSGGIFVAEPVTHANAALNADEAEWPQFGMRVLGAGEEMVLTMRIDVRLK